jgi:ribonucleoside-diphosphate reductase alpha chain
MKAGDLRCGDVLCGDGDGRWRIVDIRDGGEHDVYDLTEPQTHHFIANGLRIHNCSEYCFLDDTACNLASINLVKFLLGEEAFDFDFDFEGFELVCRFVTTILELTIDASGYPSRELAANTGIFRTLGLGYMNLGSLLMRMGIPYGSSRALQVTRALTGLMTMEAWGQSARMAQIRGVFSGLGPDRPVLERVVGYHLAALIREGTPIDRSGVSFEGLTCPPERLGADTKNDKVTAPYIDRAAARAYVNYDLVKQHGARNAQVTVLAPTGTISFACDCDTTGIEPDFSLIKHKRLAGGGYLSYANTAVYPCLMALGFTESAAEDAVNYVLAKGTIYGFTHPALQPRTLQAALEALACAQSPDANTPTVSVKAHLEMLAAAQPVLSGAVSKTINMPPDTTIDDVRATYMEAYRLGLKAVAIYRAGCKFSEPMASGHGVWSSAEVEPVVLPDWIAQGYETAQAAPPARERLPSIRTSQTYSLSVGGLPFYLTTGEYADGRLGEIFITVADEGSALSGMARTLAKQTSLMLQHRVPLETVLHSLEGGSYDPAGFVTGGTNVRMASSLTDCIARHLRNVYLPAPDVVTAIAPGVNVDVVRARPSLDGQPRFTGARCSACNSLSLQRAGSCLVCQKCGTSTGCS